MCDPLTQRVQRDAISLLYGNNTSSLVVTFCVCIAFVFGFPNNPNFQLKLYWFGAMAVVFFLRYWDLRHWKLNLKLKDYQPKKPFRRFLILRYCTASGLGIYPVIFFNTMDIIELSCTIVILAALAGGAATILAADKWLAYSYPFFMLLPVSIICLFSAHTYQHIFGVLGLVFIWVMYSSAKGAVKFTVNSLLIKNQHADLLVELEQKTQVILNANADLEEKVKQRTEQIFELSNIDPLTRLFNRNAFVENLESFIEYAEFSHKPLAVLFIDLDGFKAINDSHGHGIGDQVLIETAKRLQCLVPQKQSLCRWGGDEFLIVLQDNSVEGAFKFARQLIDKLSESIFIDHHTLSIGATIGVAMYPEHATNGTQLIALSDTAMYAQKQSRKSNVCIFTEKMRDALNREIELKNGLSLAIQNNELFVVFQPVINSRTGAISFCEALLRWEVNGTIISPVEFIPVAEQHGLIYSVGNWVLHEACKLASQWVFDKTVELSVNVSVAQLMYGGMESSVKSALAKANFPAEKLHIEITESIFAEDLDFMLTEIKAIQALGVKISVDDFGTGFSSLALLQSLSADIVKIDKTFVNSLDRGGKAIIQATQLMAEELGCSVVVEGVETEEQVQRLSLMDVECLQGFYFCKPIRVEQLPTWLSKFNRAKAI